MLKKYKGNKIVDSQWFSTSRGMIGIVIIENPDGKRKALIGHGQAIDADTDIKIIHDWGAKLRLSTVENLVKLLSENKEDKKKKRTT